MQCIFPTHHYNNYKDYICKDNQKYNELLSRKFRNINNNNKSNV